MNRLCCWHKRGLTVLISTLSLGVLVLGPPGLQAQAMNSEPQQSSATNAARSPAATVSSTPAPASQAEYVQISPIFSQLVAFSTPKGFVVGDEHTTPLQANGKSSHFYIRESVLTGETVDRWSQMITFTGLEGGASIPSMSAMNGVALLGSGYRKTCPDTFNALGLGSFDAGTYHAYAALFSCGTNPKLATPQSESALVVSIIGERDLYTIQWAIRSAPSPAKLSLDRSEWEARLKQLQPIKLCPIIPGEQPPYSSCIGSPSSQWESTGKLKPGESIPTAASSCVTPDSAQCPVEINGKLNPGILSTFQTGVTTADQVKHALGEPAYQNHNPDGRFIFEYQTGKGSSIYALVFSPEGVLNKIAVYGKTGSAQPSSNAGSPTQ